MTVIELINRLKEMPENSTVRVTGTNIDPLEITDVVLDSFEDTWLTTQDI